MLFSLLVAATHGAENYARLSSADFARLPALQQAIDLAAFDPALLAKAIFHETNRVRTQLGLKAFRAWDKLDTAAETQATIGALLRPPSHTNPFPLIATPLERVKFAGIDPKLVAENIANIPLAYSPSDIIVLATVNGRKELRDGRSMEPLSNHSYATLAAVFVDAWMKSPGHRANIVNEKLHYLGCSVQPTKTIEDVDMIFAVQVFCTPNPPFRRQR